MRKCNKKSYAGVLKLSVQDVPSFFNQSSPLLHVHCCIFYLQQCPEPTWEPNLASHLCKQKSNSIFALSQIPTHLASMKFAVYFQLHNLPQPIQPSHFSQSYLRIC